MLTFPAKVLQTDRVEVLVEEASEGDAEIVDCETTSADGEG